MKKYNFTQPADRAKFMDEFMDKIEKTFITLWSRWQDEKQFEDFKDYIKAMKDFIKKNYGDQVTVVSMTKAFKMVVEIKGFPYKPIIKYGKNVFEWSSR
jgi:hypothetical protein